MEEENEEKEEKEEEEIDITVSGNGKGVCSDKVESSELLLIPEGSIGPLVEYDGTSPQRKATFESTKQSREELFVSFSQDWECEWEYETSTTLEAHSPGGAASKGSETSHGCSGEQTVPSARKETNEEEPEVGSQAHMLQFFQKHIRSHGGEELVFALFDAYRAEYGLTKRDCWIDVEFFNSYPGVFEVDRGRHRVKLVSFSQPKAVKLFKGDCQKSDSESQRIQYGSHGGSRQSWTPLSLNVNSRADSKAFNVSKVEEEIIQILCENNRMAFLSHLKKNKKLLWLCQLCGVSHQAVFQESTQPI